VQSAACVELLGLASIRFDLRCRSPAGATVASEFAVRLD